MRLEIFDPRGRRVRTLLDESRGAGEWTVQWDGRDDAGTFVASGVYLVRLTAPGAESSTKVALVR